MLKLVQIDPKVRKKIVSTVTNKARKKNVYKSLDVKNIMSKYVLR